jgi:polysaccharide chain length determinant protein (PEP-CTERM system associated)
LPDHEESLDATLNRLLGVAVRRRWWLVLPASVVAVAVCLISLLLPARYESEATILVERQQVPERYVTANTTTDVREVLLEMTDAILSRTQLLRIIDEFDLYPKEKLRMAPEQLVELMRTYIKIEPLQRKGPDTKDLDAFTISFTGTSPRLAQKVTTKLTTLFIQENLRSREEQSTETTNFLTHELEVAGAELKQQEARVRQFKMQNLGQLPEQQQGNLAILAGLHTELQNTMATLSRAREQQVYLQSMLSQYQNLPAAGVTAPTTAAVPATDEAIKAELVRLRNQKTDLLSRYTPEYPDVVKVDEQIKETEALLAASNKAAQPTTKGETLGGDSPRSADANASTAQVKSQLEANRLEMQNAAEDAKRIEARIAEYQGRLNLTPVREAELAELSRGYDQSKQHYDDLFNKKTQSELATSLEMHQEGQRFDIIDQPSLPMKPSSPNHVKIGLAGLVAGIAVGLALTFLVESRDHSLRNEKELRSIFAFPLMIGVPVLLSKAEQQKRSRATLLEWAAGAALCLLVCATELYVFRRG